MSVQAAHIIMTWTRMAIRSKLVFSFFVQTLMNALRSLMDVTLMVLVRTVLEAIPVSAKPATLEMGTAAEVSIYVLFPVSGT